MPKHQDAGQLRAARQRRGDSRLGAAVRAQVERIEQARADDFRGGVATAGEIAGRFEHKWPTTTRHLRVLEAAGLLCQEKRGRTRVYTLDKGRLALVSDWLAWFNR